MLNGVNAGDNWQKCPVFTIDGAEGRAWVQIDLKQMHLVSKVTFWQLAGRAYQGHGVSVSKTGQFGKDDTIWLLNRELDETGPRTESVATDAPENTVGRYVRVYSGASPGYNGAHFNEVAIEGTSRITTTCD